MQINHTRIATETALYYATHVSRVLTRKPSACEKCTVRFPGGKTCGRDATTRGYRDGVYVFGRCDLHTKPYKDEFGAARSSIENGVNMIPGLEATDAANGGV